MDLSGIHEQEKLYAAWLDAVRWVPRKPQMLADGPEAFLEGWRPDEPVIDHETRVVAFGSCFAARFSEWLAENGYNRAFASGGDEAIVRNQLETPAVIAQQFRWAFGELDPDLAFWVGPDKQRFEATEDNRRRLREKLTDTDVLIVTLGLAEYWFDMLSGEPIWRTPPRNLAGRERYAFKMATVAESVQALETIDRLRRRHAPTQKIIYTVSPQRLHATFRGMSAYVANAASKAVLRAAVDEFLAAHAHELGTTYFYFPGYEVATDLFVDPLQDDNIHIRDECAELVLHLFARAYVRDVESPASPRPPSIEEALREAVVSQDARATALQALADERLAQIRRLEAELAQLRDGPVS